MSPEPDFDYLARKALIHVYNTKPCSGSREEEDRDVASLAAVLRDAATHKVALTAQEAAYVSDAFLQDVLTGYGKTVMRDADGTLHDVVFAVDQAAPVMNMAREIIALRKLCGEAADAIVARAGRDSEDNMKHDKVWRRLRAAARQPEEKA